MPQAEPLPLTTTVDHLFRCEAGKMVAVLTRLLGFDHLEQAEDIVHDTLLKALETWTPATLPDNPTAWLYRVAKNRALDFIRRQRSSQHLAADLTAHLASEYLLVPTVNALFEEEGLHDSQLRMLFACCHPALPPEQQIPLMLKTLCGLSVPEIARTLLTTEDAIEKRLSRTKAKIRAEKIPLEVPQATQLGHRLDTVLTTLYLLFNEGYHALDRATVVSEDLCLEAMRLVQLLTQLPATDQPPTRALLALLCFQASRFDARLDAAGAVVLLKDQDRAQWHPALIALGNAHLSQSAAGPRLHAFHLEAAIAAVHANAASVETTDWPQLLRLHDMLLARNDNPLVALNRAVVVGEVQGPQAALAALAKLTTLHGNVFYNTACAEMHLKAGQPAEAHRCFVQALACPASATNAEFLYRRIQDTTDLLVMAEA